MAAPFLLAFPSLSPEDFQHACRAFLARVHAVGTSTVGWSSIRLTHPVYLALSLLRHDPVGPVLKISRNIDHAGMRQCDTASPVDPEDTQLEATEDDLEAIVRPSDSSAALQVDYEILLSPTYQVPVLYFMLRRGNQPGPMEIDAVYHYLVADQYREELQAVGVMGGISLGYHPQSNTPIFFVHPCNTPDAMRQIAGHQNVTPEAYLIIWFGLIGNHLGLHLPSELLKDREQ
ncbi:ATG3/ATG10 family protein [Aspergillus affinis]|uniref:ATG3/ATG10 family protein n=1 Tax=Aspergillus affinis TaxID=1070780 RepID=UPI0022FEB02F|nr:autophagy-related protein Atg10 [Aspergillus affinis]KAI9039074.1 autophagy-related protein Atg10 [Aspergillus affinis]